MNYRSSHRDCQQWKAENLELSTTNNDAAKLFDYAIDQMYCHTPDISTDGPLGAIKKMLEYDENFAMARVFYIGLNGSARLNKDVAEAVAALKGIEDKRLTPRELLHRKAAIEWASEERLNACRTWEEILLEYPKDPLAFLFSFYGYIASGQSRMLRDCVSRVLPWWNKSDFHYGYMQGYYAFGLEQCNQFSEAEKVVKESLELIPNNSWAMHAYSHIFDATCRSQEGIDFLDANENIFSENNTLACHLYWHQTVNYTETGEYDKVLEIYDQKIKPAFQSSKAFFNLNDGCQTLQRLEFEGVDVGQDRWNDLYLCYKPYVDNHELASDEACMLISFVRSKAAREENMKDTFLQSFEEYMGKDCGSNSLVSRVVFSPFVKGICAYSEGHYEESVEAMLPVYKDIYRLGGSNAQRDLFYQLIINACMRSQLPKHRIMARSLLHERKLFRPSSMLTERIFARLMADH